MDFLQLAEEHFTHFQGGLQAGYIDSALRSCHISMASFLKSLFDSRVVYDNPNYSARVKACLNDNDLENIFSVIKQSNYFAMLGVSLSDIKYLNKAFKYSNQRRRVSARTVNKFLSTSTLVRSQVMSFRANSGLYGV